MFNTKYVIQRHGNDPDIKVSKEEYFNILKKMDKGKDKFIFRKNGDTIAISSIRGTKIIDPEPLTLLLEAPQQKPISKTFLQKKMAEMAKRFNWNSQTN